MGTYSRPALTRSYEAIYEDILKVLGTMPTDPSIGISAFWHAQADGCERLRDLWNEIAFQAAEDRTLPRWARSAPMRAREGYAREAREARAMAAAEDARSR